MIGHPIRVRVGGHLPGVGQGLWYTHEKTCLSPGREGRVRECEGV